ncbi:hypothetical protein Arub01_58880 [Actinomadura rubrobrunea]|uniref:Lactococcin 972 family bacteriocin n=1 Tax=Actinomadura rubrobrunea TaxID=115335 RepID=A0A9W6Q0B9_9ACTN|nr:hypothetical protein [Actinomadura rubrobrunea]GLW67645.1 hypothetical protein Arub01_58880 [Actinomadura rubrobrunea]
MKKIQRLAVVGVTAPVLALGAPAIALAGTASATQSATVTQSTSVSKSGPYDDGWRHRRHFRHHNFKFHNRHHFRPYNRHHFRPYYRHHGWHGGWGGALYKKSVRFAGPSGAFSSTVVSAAR